MTRFVEKHHDQWRISTKPSCSQQDAYWWGGTICWFLTLFSRTKRKTEWFGGRIEHTQRHTRERIGKKAYWFQINRDDEANNIELRSGIQRMRGNSANLCMEKISREMKSEAKLMSFM